MSDRHPEINGARGVQFVATVAIEPPLETRVKRPAEVTKAYAAP